MLHALGQGIPVLYSATALYSIHHYTAIHRYTLYNLYITPLEVGRSPAPILVRRAARGDPGRSAGQNRKRGGPGSGGARSETLRDPFDAPSGGSDQEMMPRQHGASRTPRHLVAEGGRMVQPDGGGWSDRVVGRERAIWVVGWSDGT